MVERSHGRVIMKKIDDLLGSAGLQKKEIEALVVGLGPGSFTGLRIGLAVAKGMAVALKIPLVGVSLFELAAHRFRNDSEPVKLLIPFRRDELVAALICKGRWDQGSVSIVSTKELLEHKDDCRLVGIDFQSELRFSHVDELPKVERTEFDAAELLHLGELKLSEGQAGDPAELEPLYMGKSQAELRFERRRKEE
jgi:tRNA threonylcarbamoyl adenosine modification protein YeaZ